MLTTDTASDDCPMASTHGNPFRYCSCGWMEQRTASPAEDEAASGDLAEATMVAAERVVEMFKHVRMDTPEDRALHDRVVGTARRSIAAYRRALRTAAPSVTAGPAPGPMVTARGAETGNIARIDLFAANADAPNGLDLIGNLSARVGTPNETALLELLARAGVTVGWQGRAAKRRATLAPLTCDRCGHATLGPTRHVRADDPCPLACVGHMREGTA